MKIAFILFLVTWLTVISLADSVPQSLAATVHHTKSVEQAHGDHKNAQKHSTHKQTKKSGKMSQHDVDMAKKGEKLVEKQVKTEAEHGGKKIEHFAEAGHKSFKQLQEDSQHGAKFQEGKHHKKGNFKKGFREKYHKDELKKHDSFFSNSHKSGQYKIFGKKNQKHQSNSVAKKKGNNHKKSKSDETHGRSLKKLSGHNIDLKSGHQNEKTTKSHHERASKYAKKGGKKGGKQYKYIGVGPK
ncbi:unnamed protein product [Brassicogethes aeneus]|uniref:Uncharacterized protein n=1 Tax=Brassicogethes aeneus TaxID=1431903 RepID=A0A9P0AUY3_BRAAE|nr:unnamed protein product [Brassicogethes aeneus]